MLVIQYQRNMSCSAVQTKEVLIAWLHVWSVSEVVLHVVDEQSMIPPLPPDSNLCYDTAIAPPLLLSFTTTSSRTAHVMSARAKRAAR